MPELIILTGLSGSGRTEFAEELATERNAEVLSVDRIREELAASGIPAKDKTALYGVAHERARRLLKSGRNVIFNSRNLSSRRRRNFINMVKNIEGFEAESYVILRRHDECAARLKPKPGSSLTPEEVIINQLRCFECPVPDEGFGLGVHFVNYSPGTTDLEEEYARLKGVPQTGKYHLENADNHSRMVEEAARELNISEDFVRAARYHDVGKVYAKTEGSNGAMHFPGHENVSAYIYALTLDSGDYTEEELHVLRLIQFHDVIYKDPARFASLPPELRHELELFHECDMYGAIIPAELGTATLRQLIMAFDDWRERLSAAPYCLSIDRLPDPDNESYSFSPTEASDHEMRAVRDAVNVRIVMREGIPFEI